MTGRRTAGVIAIGAMLALPGVAEAKTKTVNMGIPPASGKAFEPLGVDVNDFFPHGVTIHEGDKVKFVADRLPHRSTSRPRGGGCCR